MVAILDRWARIRAHKLGSQDRDPLSWEWLTITRPDHARWLARHARHTLEGRISLDVCAGNNEGRIVSVKLDGLTIVRLKTFLGYSEAWELAGLLLGALTRYHARGPSPVKGRTSWRTWTYAPREDLAVHPATGRPRLRQGVEHLYTGEVVL